MTLVFVYGTLKRNKSNHALLVGQRYVGEARTAAIYRLFGLGSYPGLVRDDNGVHVEGEVWEVDAAALARLDALEGLDEGLYRRELVPLLAPWSDTPVQGYLYARSVEGCPDLGVRFD